MECPHLSESCAIPPGNTFQMFPKTASDTLNVAPTGISTRAGQTQQSSRNKQYFGPLGSNLDAVGDCSCNQIKENEVFMIQAPANTSSRLQVQLHSKNSGEGSTGILQFRGILKFVGLWHSKESQSLFF